MLYLKLMLQILCESSWFVGVGLVQGCKGVTFLDYFNAYHMQIYLWDCLISLILIYSHRQ